MLNNHLSLSRALEQVHLRQELSSQWGETQSWHCFSFLKKLNEVVASPFSKLGQELITKSSWQRVGFNTSMHWDMSTKPVGIPFIVRAQLTKYQIMSVNLQMTVGARLTSKCTNNFAEKFNKAK